MTITFEGLAQLNPELTLIKKEAQGWYQRPDRWQCYEEFKGRLKRCINKPIFADIPQLYEFEVYDVAWKAIFEEGQDLNDYEEEEDYE